MKTLDKPQPTPEITKLHRSVDELRLWLYAVEQLGIPRFGETGFRLRELRTLLNRELADQLQSDERPRLQNFFDRIDSLIRQLEMLDPPFQSWQELGRQVCELGDDLEDFEQRHLPIR